MSLDRQALTVYDHPTIPVGEVDDRHKRKTPSEVVKEVGKEALRDAAALAKQYPRPEGQIRSFDNRNVVMTGSDISEVESGIEDARAVECFLLAVGGQFCFGGCLTA